MHRLGSAAGKRLMLGTGASALAASYFASNNAFCQPSQSVPLTPIFEKNMRKLIKEHKDFPKPGINFLDVFPIFQVRTVSSIEGLWLKLLNRILPW